MASGDLLADWTPSEFEASSTPPAWVMVNNQLVLAFDATTPEHAFVSGVLSSAYSGGGITVTLIWTSESATSGNCVWVVQLERQPVSHPIGTDSFATQISVTGTAPGTAGNLVYTTVNLTHGAQMDNLAVDERFRLDLYRFGSDSGDTITSDVNLVALRLTET